MPVRYCIVCGSLYGQPHEKHCIRYVPPCAEELLKEANRRIEELTEENEKLKDLLATYCQDCRKEEN